MDSLGKRIGLWYLATMVWSAVMLAIQVVTDLSFDAITLAQFGPVLGTVTMMLWRPEVYRPIVAGDFTIDRRVIVRSLATIALPFAIIGIVWLVSDGDAISMLVDSTIDTPLWVIAILWFFGCMGEEYGWRAYLQRDLEQKYQLPVAAAIVGGLWAFYHTALIFEGPIPFLTFVWTCIMISIIAAVLIAGMGKRVIWIATVLHYCINMTLLIYFNNEPVLSSERWQYPVALTAVALATLVFWYVRPGMFGSRADAATQPA